MSIRPKAKQLATSIFLVHRYVSRTFVHAFIDLALHLVSSYHSTLTAKSLSILTAFQAWQRIHAIFMILFAQGLGRVEVTV
jgi:hypothetical protein